MLSGAGRSSTENSAVLCALMGSRASRSPNSQGPSVASGLSMSSACPVGRLLQASQTGASLKQRVELVGATSFTVSCFFVVVLCFLILGV